MARVGSGTGQGGKSYNDRLLAAAVRTKALQDIQKVLDGKSEVEKWGQFKKQILLNLSKSILPRLNEHTGRDGEDLPVPIMNAAGIFPMNVLTDIGNTKGRRTK